MDKNKKKGCSGCAGCLPFIIFMLFFIRMLPGMLSDDSGVENESFESEELIYENELYHIKAESLSSDLIETEYNWSFVTSTFDNKSINLAIDVVESDVKSAMHVLTSIDNMNIDDLNITANPDIDPEAYSSQFWGGIYRIIYNKTGSQVERIAESLRQIAENERLNSNDLLQLTITLVQNIEYRIPPEDLGIVPPIVSIAREYGDCDTTALLLHSILHKLGYDTVLYYSRAYGHAMLGINTSASGEYKTRNYINYYFLEVTNPGWSIGQISADFNNIDYWSIIEL